jgi:hypothetical protein
LLPGDPFRRLASSLPEEAPEREDDTMRVQTTLRELVMAVNDAADSEEEAVATVVHLVNSGMVRLGGTLRGALIELAGPPATTRALA